MQSTEEIAPIKHEFALNAYSITTRLAIKFTFDLLMPACSFVEPNHLCLYICTGFSPKQPACS